MYNRGVPPMRLAAGCAAVTDTTNLPGAGEEVYAETALCNGS